MRLNIVYLVAQKADNKAATSKAYILRNILPEEQNDPDIIHHTDEEHESTGLLYIILALLFVNEQTMDDGNIKHLLKHTFTKSYSPSLRCYRNSHSTFGPTTCFS